MSKQLRLLKVVCQPVFAWDNGDTLEEVTTDPMTVSAAEWPHFPDRLEQMRVDQQSQAAAADTAPSDAAPKIAPVPMPTWDADGPTGEAIA